MVSDAKIYNYVSVAQLDRVLASDAKGCEFEPRRIRQKHNSLVGVFLLKLLVARSLAP